MDALKLLGCVVVICILVVLLVQCASFLCNGIIVGWNETQRINRALSEACEGFGMMVSREDKPDGRILIMCDNGKERWVKVVR